MHAHSVPRLTCRAHLPLKGKERQPVKWRHNDLQTKVNALAAEAEERHTLLIKFFRVIEIHLCF